MTPQSLSTLGWNPFFEEQLEQVIDEVTRPSVLIARVSSHLGIDVLLIGEAGELRVPVQSAEAAGEIAVGDWLVLDPQTLRATHRLKRQSVMMRNAPGDANKPQPIAANIDTLFIVSSCNEDFNLSRIERYLALSLQSGATPVVVLSKADLCDDPDALRLQAEQLHPGLSVVTINAREREQAQALAPWCGPGQTVALLGSSGVGKSTLGNALGAGDMGAGELATGGIREQDDKGRHTTTARSMHRLPTGGVLIDNPGVRELQLPDCEAGLNDLFADILSLAAECRFRNCKHETDPGCTIQAALNSGQLDQRRYLNYQKLIEEQARNARLREQRSEGGRHTRKSNKSAAARKRRRFED